MSQHIWFHYPRHISGQIAAVVLTSIIAALGLVIAAVIMVRPERGPDDPFQTVLDPLLGVVHLLDRTEHEATRSAILNAAIDAFPNLRIAELRSFATDGGNDGNDGPILFLRHQLGSRFRVDRLTADAGELDKLVVGIGFQKGAGIRVALPPPPPPLPPLAPIVGGTLVFVAVSISLLLVWATAALTAPLSRFSDAADQFGRDFEHRSLPEQGPEEIRKASRAFNRMSNRIKRLIDDRTHMLAAISHDLRTPITRMRLRSEFIEDETIRTSMLRDVEQMNEMVHSALAFIRDTRIESTASAIDLPSLLQTICDEFVEMGENVSYEGPDHLLVLAYDRALRRAVTNVVENAIRFGSKAVIQLRDTTEEQVAIDILDDGPGLSTDDPDELLGAFVRGNAASSAKNDHSGFGLGLTIAHSIIEAHGGHITFRNRQPNGLAVRLSLPAQRRAPPPIDA